MVYLNCQECGQNFSWWLCGHANIRILEGLVSWSLVVSASLYIYSLDYLQISLNIHLIIIIHVFTFIMLCIRENYLVYRGTVLSLIIIRTGKFWAELATFENSWPSRLTDISTLCNQAKYCGVVCWKCVDEINIRVLY